MMLRKKRILKLSFTSLVVLIAFKQVLISEYGIVETNRDLSDNEIRHFVTISDMPNLTLIKTLFNLTNPGHLGTPVILDPEKLPVEERIKYNRSKEENGYHNYVSNLIPIHRKSPQPIPVECQSLKYDIPRLPQTSVVVIFMNETWVTLLRTVHSIIDNTPESLLKEIILVDDNSTKEHLLKPLDDYMSRYPIVRIIRTGERVGLIRARIIGFDASTAPTVTFMDCHCECFPRWLEPQLERIASDDKIVTTPVIENINMENFGLSNAIPYMVPGFDFPSTFFEWILIPKREISRRQSPTDPILSPGMAGGLFTISRKWFVDLGKYDPGLLIWGGENTEMSLKIWMCGGSIETIPCAKVGHIFRSHPNYNYGDAKSTQDINMGRVASVWMDDYKKSIPNWDGHIVDIGDVSDRVKIRERLQCKSFQWFIDNVHPEIYILGDGVYAGEIRSSMHEDLCIDGGDLKETQLPISYRCHGEGVNQKWDFTDRGEIRNQRLCFDNIQGHIELRKCHASGGNQKWHYEDQQIMTINRNMCVSLDLHGQLILRVCDGSGSQKWRWRWNREPRSYIT